MLPSQRKVTATQAIEVDMAYKYGIQQKLYEQSSRAVKGRENLGYLILDYNNYLCSRRRNAMTEGNAGGLLINFQKQQAKNPLFFYLMQRILKMQMYLKIKMAIMN